MKPLVIERTSKTPAIKFDEQQGILEIRGKSIPENATEFYKPLIEKLTHYTTGKRLPIQVDIFLDYFNTSSSKYLLDIFRILEVFYQSGNQVSVNWYHEKGDDDMYQAGDDYKSMLGLPFNIKISAVEIEIEM